MLVRLVRPRLLATQPSQSTRRGLSVVTSYTTQWQKLRRAAHSFHNDSLTIQPLSTHSPRIGGSAVLLASSHSHFLAIRYSPAFSTLSYRLAPRDKDDAINNPSKSSFERGIPESPPVDPNARAAREDEEARWKGPLPDLRHGIPSTLESETSDRSSSFKDQESEAPSLNLTEDPNASENSRRGEGELPREAYVSSIERRRNAFARWAYASAGLGIIGTALYFGWNFEDAEEMRRHPEMPGGWGPGAFWERIKIRTSHSLGFYTEPAFPKLLPDQSALPAEMRFPYTLVLSLEDLLVSSTWSREHGWQVAKRPGMDYFLRYLSQYYELVIFTSVQSMNADMIIKKLDPYQIIMFPLYREATRYMNGEHVKDLSYLNRDLSKTIIVDTNPAHTSLQPENAVILPKWNGSAQDPRKGDLVAMIPFLEYIATMSIEDVRKVLKSYEGKHIPTEFARREAQAREAFNERIKKEKGSRRLGGGAGGLGGMLGFKQQSQGQLPGEPSLAEGFAQGMMLSDQYRERGRRNYEHLERQIRENGAEILRQREEEEKKMMEEAMNNMKNDWFGGFSKFLPGGGSKEQSDAEQQGDKS